MAWQRVGCYQTAVLSSFLLLGGLTSSAIAQTGTTCNITESKGDELTCARIYQIQQDVRLKAPDRGIENLLTPGTDALLFPEESLETGSGSRAELQFNEGSLAWSRAGTVFEFMAGLRQIQLTDGAVLVMVQPGNKPLEVMTAEAKVKPPGTAYIVRRDASQRRTEVIVLTNNLAGPVVVTNPTTGQPVAVLRAGQQITVFAAGVTPIEKVNLAALYQTDDLVQGLGPGQESVVSQKPPSVQRTLNAVRTETLAALSQVGAIATGTSSVTDFNVPGRVGLGFASSGSGYDGNSYIEGFVPLGQVPGSNLTFLNGRFAVDNSGDLGGNIIVGHRAYSESANRTFGGYVGYDTRSTGKNSFQQIGLGFESLGKVWDVRSNAYFPAGGSRKLTSQSASESAQFSNLFFRNHFLVVDGTRTRQETSNYEIAMTGFDVEAGAKLTNLGPCGDLRGYGGMYYYAGPGLSSTVGWRARLEARPTDHFNVGVGVQRDNQSGTTVMVNAGTYYPGYRPASLKCAPDSVVARLGEPLQRTNSVVVDTQTISTTTTTPFTIVATNPANGQPWFFNHVAAGGNSDGRFEDPYATIAEAVTTIPQDGNGIIYVAQTNPEVSPGFTIPDNVQVLSRGPAQPLSTNEFGNIQIPLSGTGQLPKIAGTVRMGNNTTLSGFDITSPPDTNGVEGDKIANVTIRDNRISSGGDFFIGGNAIAPPARTLSPDFMVPTVAAAPSEPLLEGNNGVALNDVTGRVLIQNNTIQPTPDNRLRNGIIVSSATSDSSLPPTSNVILNNTLDNTTASGGISINSTENTNQQNIVSNNSASGIILSSRDSSKQENMINSNTIDYIIPVVSGTAQQTNMISNNTVESFIDTRTTDEAIQANIISGNDILGRIIIQASDNTRQFNAINSNTFENNDRSIVSSASDNAQQITTISSNTITRNEFFDSFPIITTLASSNARQTITINNNTINNKPSDFPSRSNSLEIIAYGNSQVTADIGDNQVINPARNGIEISANDDSKVIASIHNNQITNSTRNDNEISPVGNGILVTANDRSQVTAGIQVNQITDPTESGVRVSAGGNSQVTADILDNQITILTGNGFERNGILVTANDDSKVIAGIRNNQIINSTDNVGEFPFNRNGIQITAIGNSQVTADILDNQITNPIGDGIQITAIGNSQVTADIHDNQITNPTRNGINIAQLSKQSMCVRLASNTVSFSRLVDFNLERDLEFGGGEFRIVNLPNLQSQNTGIFNFVPNIESFTNVTACP